MNLLLSICAACLFTFASLCHASTPVQFFKFEPFQISDNQIVGLVDFEISNEDYLGIAPVVHVDAITTLLKIIRRVVREGGSNIKLDRSLESLELYGAIEDLKRILSNRPIVLIKNEHGRVGILENSAVINKLGSIMTHKKPEKLIPINPEADIQKEQDQIQQNKRQADITATSQEIAQKLWGVWEPEGDFNDVPKFSLNHNGYFYNRNTGGYLGEWGIHFKDNGYRLIFTYSNGDYGESEPLETKGEIVEIVGKTYSKDEQGFPFRLYDKRVY